LSAGDTTHLCNARLRITSGPAQVDGRAVGKTGEFDNEREATPLHVGDGRPGRGAGAWAYGESWHDAFLWAHAPVFVRLVRLAARDPRRNGDAYVSVPALVPTRYCPRRTVLEQP